MDLSALFKDIHGAVSRKDFVLYKRVNLENALEIADCIDLDINHLYYNENAILHKIVYWDKYFYYHFHGDIVTKEAIKFINDDTRFRAGKERVERLIASGEYNSLFAFYDKKVIMEMYNELYNEIPDKDKYNIFTELYQRSESNFHLLNNDIIADVFTKRFLSSNWEYRIEEFNKLSKDKPYITAYRGEGDETGEFLSWTLSEKTAKFFANRFGAKGRIITERVDPSRVLDYLTSRGEEELLIKPI
jgi:hypothetical protein